MTRCIAGIALTLLLSGSPVCAGEPCPCGYDAPHQSHLRRLCDKLQRPCCGADKTHLDMGCTGWRADCVFAFGTCCEFFAEPPPIQPLVPPHRWFSWLKKGNPLE